VAAAVIATFAVTHAPARDCTVGINWSHRILDALRARGLDELAGRLTGYDARLGKLAHDACVAGAPPERMACFETCKTSLRAITTSLGDAEPAAAWHRVAALPPPEACRSDEALRLSPIGPAHQALMEKLARSSFDFTVSLDD